MEKILSLRFLYSVYTNIIAQKLTNVNEIAGIF
jgi:hypothetical protein